MSAINPPCPRCDQNYLITATTDPTSYHCKKCNGLLASFSYVQDHFKISFIEHVMQLIEQKLVTPGSPCPYCTNTMALVKPFAKHGHAEEYFVVSSPDPVFAAKAPALAIDVCEKCNHYWFDNQEWTQIPTQAPVYDQSKTDSPYVATFIGQPVVEGMIEPTDQPIISWGIFVLCFAMTALGLHHEQFLINFLTLDASDLLANHGVNLVTSLFSHADIFHFLGNMYFLITFGRYVEARIGAQQYLVLFFAAGIIGSFVQAYAFHFRPIHMLGASGAISGIITYFCLSFPKAQVSFYFLLRRNNNPFTRYQTSFTAPAYAFGFVWVLLQMADAIRSGSQADIGYWCHVGGAAVGFLCFILNWGSD